MQIDFFYFDVQTCNRCQKTYKNLTAVLRELGVKVKIYKHKLNDHEENVNGFGLVVSPSIFVNGSDIFKTVKTSLCGECSGLVGTSVNCRAESEKENAFSKRNIKLALKKVI